VDRSFWNGLSNSSKLSLMAGVFIILISTALAAFFLLKVDYQILFSDLKPQDSAVMVSELDRLKIPYKLDDSGNTILVEKEAVHTTRLKLLSKDLPLHGAVGFELFNNSDFGMTEFAQKINYQRAMQGEITRTILSLDEIKDVRVHLAMPEEGLFKRATSKAKAAVTIALKPGKKLRGEQIAGIQRLVAAAVPGIVAQDVTIVDRQGVALTRVGSSEADMTSGNLELKKDTEALLSKKANEVLEHMFGAGQALASVDVILNMDLLKTTTEDVLPAPSSNGHTAAGVIVKERQSSRDLSAPLDAAASNQSSRTGNVQREVDYQVGRRIEQIVSQPGAIKHISVVAVVQKSLDAEQQEKLKNLVATAVGASIERGDNVVVQNIFNSGLAKNEEDALLTTELGSRASISTSQTNAQQKTSMQNYLNPQMLIGVILLGFLAVAVALLIGMKKLAQNKTKTLTDQEREIALVKIREWMGKESPARHEFSDQLIRSTNE